MADILSSFSTCHHLPADCGRMVFLFFFFSFSNHNEVKQNRLCFLKPVKASLQTYRCFSFECLCCQSVCFNVMVFDLLPLLSASYAPVASF